jgi:adenylate cyclase
LEGGERTFSLSQEGLRIGRGADNDVVLADPSVSRYHASVRLDDERARVVDLGSTNGVLLNGERVSQAPLAAGDLLRIGAFELSVVGGDEAASERWAEPAGAPPLAAPSVPVPFLDGPPRPAPGSGLGEGLLATGSFVRPLAAFREQYGLDAGVAAGIAGGAADADDITTAPRSAASPPTITLPRLSSEEAYSNTIFGYMTRLAGLLLTAETIDQVLARVTDICFEALPVDRGFILLLDDGGRAVCALARFGERVEMRPVEAVPVSKTMLDQVVQKRVALMTLDAQEDQRLLSGESIRMHQIRAAMCAPLWSHERIVGVIQVDSPFRTDCFSQRDLDFLVAVANFTAVAIERIRSAEEAQRERRLLDRMERYHSPAVIEAVLQVGEERLHGEFGRLQPAQASVLFADLVGFSAIAEAAEPTAVARLLEGYFDRAVEAIFEAGGTLDKFIGDCVMAFFGTPIVHPDHARRAVGAAIEIQRAVARWNGERRRAGLVPIECRVAINSGPVMVGEVGSRQRVDYTVLGNTVNVAARLEQFVARPGDVVVGADCWRQLDGVPGEALGAIQLKGLQRKVEAFRLDRGLWEEPA